MRKSKQNLTWPDLYQRWKNISSLLDSPALEEAQFLQINSPYIPSHARNVPFDWWPKSEIQQRLAFYSGPSYMNPYATKAGTVHTAELLWNARGNLEQQHLIYILASFRDKHKEYPHSWHGAPFQLFSDVSGIAREQLPEEIYYWHHASKNALPIQLLDTYSRAADLLIPQEVDDLMYIAALEASLSAANWQLIEFSMEPAQNFRVIK